MKKKTSWKLVYILNVLLGKSQTKTMNIYGKMFYYLGTQPQKMVIGFKFRI